MTRNCGNCRFTEKGGENLVWCLGAPPAVKDSRPAENGGTQVQMHPSPLLAAGRTPCALHKRRSLFARLFRKE